MNSYIRLFNTVKYLKFIQIFYRIYYVLRLRYRRQTKHKYLMSSRSQAHYLILQSSIGSNISYENKTFIFLNLSYSFEDKINWNYSEYGKLWTYNLTYFDYLNQKAISKEDGTRLIYDFIEQADEIKDGLEPFPISLRGINWIKFISKYKIEDQKINDFLFAQYFILMDNIEYHILGNHLLENAFSLLFGAYYFQNEKFYVKAKKILIYELEEQILDDGAHFELSPMYHQIMLFRVLDCINLIQNNSWKNQELLDLLISKSEIMIGWLNIVTYKNGNIPLLNDSANGVAPTTKELLGYAKNLKLIILNSKLSSSGYRKFKNEHLEIIIDVGNIGPDYIPGHSHSDTFNFELYVRGKPLIVDTGTSTYETNKRRIYERSTCSHNTVMIDEEDQSEVWDAFRVARRAKIIQLRELDNIIEATHDGYKRIGVLHTRKFMIQNKSIVIEDHIESSLKHKCVAYFHFYPGIEPEINGSSIIVNDVIIKIENAEPKIENYFYVSEFNMTHDAKKVVLVFTDILKVKIKL